MPLTGRQATDRRAAASPAGARQASLARLFDLLHTSEHGLTGEDARRRLAEAGPNDPSPARRAHTLLQIASLFANPLVIILVIASIASAALGEAINASIIVVIVLLNVGLNFVQTYRAHRAAEDLREQVAATATVLRDGDWAEVPRRTIVPGDVIRLVAGDLVPADARLIEARDLHVQESALTGESMPAEKEAGDPGPASQAPAEARNAVFLGTSVVSGTARALVVATGRATAFGDIAARLATRPPETEFDRGTRQFGLFIMRTVFFLVLFVSLTGAALRHDVLESFLFAVALAVGLTPENLPMITAVTLGQGAVRMAHQKVIVKHLSAIQNFGSIDVLCSDKTGTLTRGEMTLDRCLDPLGAPSERGFLLACVNSACQTGIRSPLDVAILQRGLRPSNETARHLQETALQQYRKIDEIPFDFERRRLSVVAERDGERLLITKGAPEGIFALASAFETDGARQAFDAGARARSEALYQALSREGFRVLAVAYRGVPVQDAYRAADERELVLAGLLAFIDPPLEDVRDVLDALRRDGIAVKILTGDSDLVARHVCAQVGLDPGVIVLGDEVARMNDAALAHVAEQTTVFARVSPAQKNRIILALKSRSHVVGFLGDGINDAPSLHAADVGISVASGVDVAKDAADIILLERSLRVLHNGIVEGRKAFGNVMKYLLMGTSSNFGNMLSMAGASVFLPFLPMLPMQILLNNFLYDFAQVTIPTDNVDRAFMQKPRRWDIALIRDFMVFIGPISSIYDFLTFFVLLYVFHASPALFHTGWFVESLATQTLVIFVIRTAANPLRSRPSLPLAVTTIPAVLVGAALPFTALAEPLGFVPLSVAFFVFLIVACATYLLLVEGGKRILMRRLLG